MATIDFFWFGSPEIRIDHQPVEMETRKATALLVYLSVTEKPHTRESLATLLWPEHDTQRALANLRRTLWSLNNSPVGPWLNAGRDTVSLAREGQDAWVDVVAFRQLTQAAHQHQHPDEEGCPGCLDDLRKAVDLYRGDFLTGFTLADSPEFDDWQFFESDSLRQALAQSLQIIQESLKRSGLIEDAIPYARRWVSLDRLNETAQAALVALYAGSGQRSAALRQYEELTGLLHDEIGAEPQPQTKALIEQVRSGALSPQAPVEPARLSPPPIDLEPPVRTPIKVLPTAATPFIGRTQETREVNELLNDPNCGLLTLIGPGGVGKTRLAIHVAEENQQHFADGVVYVPLAPRLTPEGILPTLSTLLQFRPGEEGDQITQLVRYLANKEMLLVFDNFEHLTRGAGLLVSILQSAPRVKILVTSRERLNLSGESIYILRGMRYPRSLTDASIENFSAYKLFLANARRVIPGYEPTEAERSQIARICRLVEGMPLAIELASGWMYILSAEEIAAEIERNIDFLTSRRRDVESGHRSLRAVFEHSWNLLPAAEQALFARLSVFRGGFEREAAQNVAGADLATLSGLVDRSLLHMSPDRRFTTQELTRQFAEEMLKADPEAEQAALQRHSEFYAHFLEQQEKDIKSHRQKEALEAIHKEIENVRLSWVRAVKSSNWAYIDRTMESVYLFYNIYSWSIEGEALFRIAVEMFQPLFESDPHLSDERKLIFARLLIRHNSFLLNLYQKDRPRQQIELARPVMESLAPIHELAAFIIQDGLSAPEDHQEETVHKIEVLSEQLRSTGDLWTLSQVLNYLSIRCDTLFEQRFTEETYEIARRIGNRKILVEILNSMGNKAQMLGDYATAKERFLEGLAIGRQVNYRWGLALSLDYAGYASRLMGDYNEAERLHQESLQVHREIDDQLGIAGSLDNLGLVYLDRGEPDVALDFFQRGLAIREQIKDPFNVEVSLENLAFAYLELGNLEAAEETFKKSLPLAEETEFHWGWIRTMGGLISLNARRGDTQAAIRLFKKLHGFILVTGAHLQTLSVTILLFVLSEIFIAQRKPEKAVPMLRTAIHRRETWAGLRQKAERQLDRALKQAGTDGEGGIPPGAQKTVQECLDEIGDALETL